MRWLKGFGTIHPLPSYLGMSPAERKQKRAFALTFDDGLASTHIHAFGWLREQRIPATHFVATSHLEEGKPLWFSYLNALCFERAHDEVTVNGKVYTLTSLPDRKKARESLGALAHASGNPVTFCETLAKRYPLEPWIMREYSGMTYKQVSELGSDNLFEVGAHTVTHVYLSQVPEETQVAEVEQSRAELERLTGRQIRYFAYPVGDYSRETLDVVKRLGFQASFATDPKRIGSDPRFEIERVGIYSDSLLKLKLKVFGLVQLARRMGFSLG